MQQCCTRHSCANLVRSDLRADYWRTINNETRKAFEGLPGRKRKAWKLGKGNWRLVHADFRENNVRAKVVQWKKMNNRSCILFRFCINMHEKYDSNKRSATAECYDGVPTCVSFSSSDPGVINLFFNRANYGSLLDPIVDETANDRQTSVPQTRFPTIHLSLLCSSRLFDTSFKITIIALTSVYH